MNKISFLTIFLKEIKHQLNIFMQYIFIVLIFTISDTEILSKESSMDIKYMKYIHVCKMLFT